MRRREVDRPTTGDGDGNAVDARKEPPQAFRRFHDSACIPGEYVARRRARAPAAAAERDASIRRGSEVAHRGAEVAYQLARHPVNGLKTIGRGRGEDDVAAPGHEPAPKLLPFHRPRVDGHHRVLTPH